MVSEIGYCTQNTIDIVDGCSSSETAADICTNLTLNDLSDWFLPSKDELNEMYLNKDKINATAIENGGTAFASAPHIYWSSTEDGDFTAWTQGMDNGFICVSGKHDSDCVRAIRAF